MDSVMFLFTHCSTKDQWKELRTISRYANRSAVAQASPDMAALLAHMVNMLMTHKDKLIIKPANLDQSADPTDVLDVLAGMPSLSTPSEAISLALSDEALAAVESGCKDLPADAASMIRSQLGLEIQHLEPEPEPEPEPEQLEPHPAQQMAEWTVAQSASWAIDTLQLPVDGEVVPIPGSQPIIQDLNSQGCSE